MSCIAATEDFICAEPGSERYVQVPLETLSATYTTVGSMAPCYAVEDATFPDVGDSVGEVQRQSDHHAGLITCC
eukprot:353251-Chlamydomonas_euryale.AAC.2